MIRAYTCRPGREIVVEIGEIAHRFREAPEAIHHALVLLSGLGCADPDGRNGCWRLRLASSPRNDLTIQNRGVAG
jgi:hypothetical protein